ncbi:MAG: Gfo/Idh/MocA family protein [Coprobacillaceae bacterium]
MRIGIIGSGFIVHTFINAAKQHKDIVLQAVYSRSEEKAQELSKKYDIPMTYTDLNLLLEDPTIDFIYVASPNSLHYQQSLLALKANKHVICEKPFSTTPEELQELISLAKEKQLFLFEAITTIHLPNYQKVHELLPSLGNIKLIQCNFSQYSSRYDAFLKGENPNVFNPAFSGGVLMDLNIYNLHFVLGLFGQPNTSQYYVNKADNGIDTSGIAILQYPTFIASCVAAKDSASSNILQIQGDKGYIIVSSSSICQQVEYHLLDGRTETYNLQKRDNHLYYELDAFVRMYQQQDLNSCYQLLNHSSLVLQTATTLRHSAGIYFPIEK